MLLGNPKGVQSWWDLTGTMGFELPKALALKESASHHLADRNDELAGPQ